MNVESEQILAELAEHFRPVFEQSPDGVYLWLDETHMVCNERLARIFGYTQEEVRAHPPALDQLVAGEDSWLFAWNYQHRIAPPVGPITFRFRGQRKDGTTFPAETDMIPIGWRGQVVVYHFVREIVA